MSKVMDMARGSCLTERRGCGQHSVARAVRSPGHTRSKRRVGENRQEVRQCWAQLWAELENG